MRHFRTPLALLVLATAAAGQEERAIDNFAGVGVRAMAMGGAFAGLADDFTAVYWNPAGLAQMRQREINVAFLRNARQNRAVAGFGTPIENSAIADVSNTRFGSLGFVYPVPVYRGSLVLAAGFNRVKDFDWALDFPLVPVVRDAAGAVLGDSLAYDDSFRHEGELAITSVAGAIDVSPSVSVGATLSLIGGEDEWTSEFVSIDTEDFFYESRFTEREVFVDDYGTTWTATLGAMVRTPRDDPRLRLGVTMATGSSHKVSYTWRAPPQPHFSSVESDNGELVETPSEEFKSSYRIALPLSFGLGVSGRPVPQVTLAASVHATEWTQTEYTDDDPFELRTDTSFEDQYADVLRWHLGAEWQVPWAAVDLRAGYYSDPLPFVGPRDPTRTPDPVDNPLIRVLRDRRFYTLGAGVAVEEAVRIDLAYTRGNYEQAEGENELELREDVDVNRVFMGVRYLF